jgi:hypothetical protein
MAQSTEGYASEGNAARGVMDTCQAIAEHLVGGRVPDVVREGDPDSVETVLPNGEPVQGQIGRPVE